MTRWTRRSALAAALVAGAALPAVAQGGADLPTRPIRFVVVSAPGGGTDLIGRAVARGLQERLGIAVVVENRPGAAGNIATEHVGRAAPDGTTLLMTSDSFAANAGLFDTLPYDPVGGFAPVALIARSSIVVGVGAGVPARDLRDLLDATRARPGTVAYASCGTGTAQHVAGEMLKVAAGVEMTHVTYRGCAPALTDVLAGTVPVFWQSLSNVLAPAADGRVRLLGVAAPARLARFPALPTIAEQGFPGFDVHPWYGLLAPAGTPRPVVERLGREIVALVAGGPLAGWLAERHYDPDPMGPADFTQVVRTDVARWSRSMRELGIRAE
jgi:tripartite-type tricarboxylate transporter receptor subunit TctC